MSDAQEKQDIPLMIFAKAPVPGQVKTRLMDRCDAEAAAYIAELLLSHMVKIACQHWPGRVVISVAGDQQHSVFATLKQKYLVECIGQSDGDLGVRMHHAFDFAFKGSVGPAAIIGADVPHCSADVLQEAWLNLSNGANIIGPAVDGGYYLIGLQQPCVELFDGVDWGTSKVYQQTLDRARDVPLSFHVLPSLSDLDTWADIKAFIEDKPMAIPELTELYESIN